MIEVTVTYTSGKKESFSSEKSSVMVGKAMGNDIIVDADGVSRYHARLSIVGDNVTVEDLDSTNGTYINSEKISTKKLERNDKVAIGKAFLEVRTEANSSSVKKEEVTTPKATPTKEAKVIDEEIKAAKSKGSDESDFYWKSMQNFLGPIWKYVDNEEISEIMINGPKEIYIESKGILKQVPETFTNDQLHAAVLNIAQYVGRRVSEEEPYLDARLPDGSRVAVLMEPCSRKGTSVAIRKFAKEALTIDKLIGYGSITREMATFLESAVKLKKNIIVSGGTSSGKTSLLNVVAGLVPNDERIITIEDSAELQLAQDHVVPMETKPPDKKGRGEITIRDLVKVSLRMRPDRIIVGEIRGGEAIDLLQAMNTGHSGSKATLHASSPRQALSRLETLALFSGLEIPMLALREQVASAVDLVIQAARLSDHSRKVTHISEIGQLRDDGTYEVNDIYKYVREGRDPETGKIIGTHKWMGYKPSFLEEMELSGLTEAVNLFEE